MMNYYEILKAAKSGGKALDYYTAMYAQKLGIGDEIAEFEGIPPLTFTANGQPLIDWRISGNMVQSGTPAPDNIIYPQECGDKTPNLAEFRYGNIIYNTGEINYNDNRYFVSNYVKIDGNQYYKTANATLCYYDDTYTFISGEYTNSKKYVAITPPENAVYVVFGNPVQHTPEWASEYLAVYKTNIDHVIPYGYKFPITINNTTYSIYLNESLRKIGDYADTINADSTVTRKIKKIVLTGDESWTPVGEGNTRFFYTTLGSRATTEVTPSPLISSHFELASISSASADVGMRIINGEQLRVRPKNAGSTTTAAFKQWLSENTPSIWYVLNTSETERITAFQIPTASGNNTLDVDTTLPPSNLYIKYYK